MRVKRYVADTVPEAIAQVKQDLGRNAIILHTKPFNEGGFMGLFSKRRFEVIAAVDEEQTSAGIAKMRPESSKLGFTPLNQAIEAIAERQETVPLAGRSFRSNLLQDEEVPIVPQELVLPKLNSSEIAERRRMITEVNEPREFTPLHSPKVESPVGLKANAEQMKSSSVAVLSRTTVFPEETVKRILPERLVSETPVIARPSGNGVIKAISPQTERRTEPALIQPRGTGVIESILPRETKIEAEAKQIKAENIENEALWQELAEMKKMLQQVAAQASSVPQEQQRQKWFNHLKGLGLEAELINDLLDRTSATELNATELSQSNLLHHWTQMLLERLVCNDPFPVNLSGQQVLALIGPTGVGKTTTIAKLAANFHLFEGKKVGLVTIDTYRIAAVEHLKTYGDIINLPVEVVYSPADLPLALQKLQQCELVLVDTAGRSPYNRPMMDELQKFFNQGLVSTIMLAISATTKYADMLNIVEKFTKVPYTHLIFTKLDETSCLGPLVSLAWKTRQPISYFTMGQNVPDDIEIAKPQLLITRLFKGNIDD